jgi:RimJ/RimL family protein N-acetyltransferase
MINSPLFIGSNIRLTAINPETDSVTESTWTHDPAYARLISQDGMAKPVSASVLKKRQEEANKESTDNRNSYYFAIRQCDNDQLIGFLRIPFIGWSHGFALLRLNFGSPEALNRYGQEAITLALVYMFGELNLFRIAVHTPEYAQDYIDLYQQAGFVLEVRQREYVYGQGRLWDNLVFALLSEDWVMPYEEVLA